MATAAAEIRDGLCDSLNLFGSSQFKLSSISKSDDARLNGKEKHLSRIDSICDKKAMKQRHDNNKIQHGEIVADKLCKSISQGSQRASAENMIETISKPDRSAFDTQIEKDREIRKCRSDSKIAKSSSSSSKSKSRRTEAGICNESDCKSRSKGRDGTSAQLVELVNSCHKERLLMSGKNGCKDNNNVNGEIHISKTDLKRRSKSKSRDKGIERGRQSDRVRHTDKRIDRTKEREKNTNYSCDQNVERRKHRDRGAKERSSKEEKTHPDDNVKVGERRERGRSSRSTSVSRELSNDEGRPRNFSRTRVSSSHLQSDRSKAVRRIRSSSSIRSLSRSRKDDGTATTLSSSNPRSTNVGLKGQEKLDNDCKRAGEDLGLFMENSTLSNSQKKVSCKSVASSSTFKSKSREFTDDRRNRRTQTTDRSSSGYSHNHEGGDTSHRDSMSNRKNDTSHTLNSQENGDGDEMVSETASQSDSECETEDEHMKRLKERRNMLRQRPHSVTRSRSLSRSRGIPRNHSLEQGHGTRRQPQQHQEVILTKEPQSSSPLSSSSSLLMKQASWRSLAKQAASSTQVDTLSKLSTSGTPAETCLQQKISNSPGELNDRGHAVQGLNGGDSDDTSEADDINSEEEVENQTNKFVSFLKFANPGITKKVTNSNSSTLPSTSSTGISRLMGAILPKKTTCSSNTALDTHEHHNGELDDIPQKSNHGLAFQDMFSKRRGSSVPPSMERRRDTRVAPYDFLSKESKGNRVSFAKMCDNDDCDDDVFTFAPKTPSGIQNMTFLIEQSIGEHQKNSIEKEISIGASPWGSSSSLSIFSLASNNNDENTCNKKATDTRLGQGSTQSFSSTSTYTQGGRLWSSLGLGMTTHNDDKAPPPPSLFFSKSGSSACDDSESIMHTIRRTFSLQHSNHR